MDALLEYYHRWRPAYETFNFQSLIDRGYILKALGDFYFTGEFVEKCAKSAISTKEAQAAQAAISESAGA
jgi:hypothetical protein